ncbi:MAG: tripartite tricarboxylate transporter substrate binding protein [Rhizobiales bacterium]|nr:tripartite tricarboxylate transporter substrate binding protein [Hyphomicrobiales bacterium]
MRRVVGSFLVAGALALALAPAHADNYPSRRITLIAPWPPAGAIDTTCRELAPGVADLLGQPVVVENRPGAGSTVGTADGAKAAPDGYTLVLAGSGSLAISPMLYKELPYDPRKDFTPIALVVRVPFILVVNPSLPIESVADLINYAKAHPGVLTYGSGGAGSPHQLFAEMFKTMTGIEMTHVPYKGSAPALTDVVGGHIALLFADPAPALPLIKAGKVRALGVTSAALLPAAPDIPPLAQSVPGFDAAGWGMVVAPARTPATIVRKLYDAFRTVQSRSEVRDRLSFLGLTPQTSPPPEALQNFIDDELARWGKVVRSAGLAGTE